MPLKPAENTTEFMLPAGQYMWLDSAWVLSQMNRKQFRQGYQYGIQNIEVSTVGSSAQSVDVDIGRLSTNWVTANAWVKGFKHWLKQQEDALDDAGGQSTQGAYRDFKIYMNIEHANSTATNRLTTPLGFNDLAGATAIDSTVKQDWSYSEVVVPNNDDAAFPPTGDTVEFGLYMNGPDSPNAAAGYWKGLIHAYADSRSRPNVPEVNTVQQVSLNTEGGLYAEMENVGDDMNEIIENARYRNNDAPYIIGDESTYEWYPYGASLNVGTHLAHRQDTLRLRSGSGSVATDNSGPFVAPCGLLQFANLGDNDVVMRITWARGEYHGIAAASMEEMN